MSSVRGLYEAAGMNVVELKNNRYDSLCCGVGSLLRCSPNQSGDSEDTQRKMKQIMETGVDNVSFDCHGCVANLSQATEGTNIKLHYAMNNILDVFGKEVKHVL